MLYLIDPNGGAAARSLQMWVKQATARAVATTDTVNTEYLKQHPALQEMVRDWLNSGMMDKYRPWSLARCIEFICDPSTDGVVLGLGWERDPTCQIELAVAQAIGKTVHAVHETPEGLKYMTKDVTVSPSKPEPPAETPDELLHRIAKDHLEMPEGGMPAFGFVVVSYLTPAGEELWDSMPMGTSRATEILGLVSLFKHSLEHGANPVCAYDTWAWGSDDEEEDE